jgi:segregation and condensation protein B
VPSITNHKPTSEPGQPPEERRHIELIEAALYVAGRPLDVKTLGAILKIHSKKRIQSYARTLMEEYRARGGALEILEFDDGRFVLQLKTQYVTPVKRLTMRPLLSTGPLKTLSFIAYHQPVVQSHVTAVRGSQAYLHIRELKRVGLITTEKLGRTQVLRTSEVFADYFNLSHNTRLMKRQLQSLFNSMDQPEPEAPGGNP